MDRSYDDIAVFVAVARESSFRGAARELNMPVSSVSRRIASLEARLGSPLMRRTTRALSLTPAGVTLYARARAAFDELDVATETIMGGMDALRGRLVVTAPPIVCTGEWTQFLLGFAERHADITLDLRLTNATPDLVAEGIDLSFQFGPLAESSNIARKLWPVRKVICASPTLLSRYPELLTIDHPRSLKKFPAVTLSPGLSWRFVKEDKHVDILPPSGGACTNDVGLAAEAIRLGLGVGYVPAGVVHGHTDKDYVCLPLGGWRPSDESLFAVYPASRQLNPKVRALIDYVLSGPKDAEGPADDEGGDILQLQE